VYATAVQSPRLRADDDDDDGGGGDDDAFHFICLSVTLPARNSRMKSDTYVSN